MNGFVSCNTYEAISMYPQAPVSGSKKPAEDGQLIFLTAGEYSYSTAYSIWHGKSVVEGIFNFLQENLGWDVKSCKLQHLFPYKVAAAI